MSIVSQCSIGDLELDSGVVLVNTEIAYTSYGRLNDDHSNVVIVFHALTGNLNAADWWNGIIADAKPIDPNKYYIICFNMIGSCYGSTGPERISPNTGEKYASQFPKITIHDIARSQLRALEKLGIHHVSIGIGGSMGAMVMLELAILAPNLFERIISIACGVSHSAWRIAFSSVIRKTIECIADASGNTGQGFVEGMKLARQIGMISYRSSDEFKQRFSRDKQNEKFEVEHYLEHQADKIAARFSPYSYLRLTEAMESFDIRERISEIISDVLIIGIDSDILYPESELREVASQFPHAEYKTLSAGFGHDSFLVAQDKLAELIVPFISRSFVPTVFEGVYQ